MPVGSASPQTICSGNVTGVSLNSTITGSTYTWTAALQSGSVTGFSNCTSGCGNSIAQTLTGAGVVRYTVTPVAAGCAGNAFTVDVTVSAIPTATIVYSGSPYLSGSGTANVTQTGQTGGTYSATPSGLSLNTANGQININSSFANTYTVKYVFSNGTCTDSTTATLTITPTNDTTTTTPTCPTCPVTVCAVVDDVDTTGGAAYSTPCGTPAGYTASAVSAGGCITYTPTGTVTDTAQACIVTCNNGRCDTTRVILYPPVPTNDTVITTPSCPTCPVVVCPVFDDVSSTAVTSVTTCGTPAEYTLTGPDVNHCYTYTPNGTATDTVEGCIIVCDGNRCDTTRVIIYPPQQTINHDWNVAFTNMPVNGNVATNDQVYTNTSYGNIQANSNNPTAQTPVLNSNGTYTFTASQPGNYEFTISVCAPGQTTGCPTQLLQINVRDSATNANAMPIANLDMVTTTYQTPVSLPTLDNDASGNYGGSLNPASVTITNMPNHGTIDSIGVNGDIYYHPATGFTGTDTLVYSVCDQLLSSNCDTAYQIIKVLPPGAANTTAASDDYAYTLANSPVSGNAKDNDHDPEGNTLTVTPATVTNANGSFTINDQGNYTFTPAVNFVGSAQYSYQVCDNGTPVACAVATVYVLVYPANTTPLPVKVIDFNGKALNNHSNLLTWKVTDVKAMDSYEILRSTDQKAWTSLGSLTAENRDGVQSMQLMDNNPDMENFYKLVLHGQNGASEVYPKIVHIRRSSTSSEWAKLYPNPAETIVNLEYYSLDRDGTIQVDLMDVTGRRISSVKHLLSEGSNVISINISGIADGVYNIRYTNTGNGRQENLKFIKKTK
ncbi:T9SS type A sorting domain-containing protein [Taibaiella lutea]|uniref:T9SS type A sorting domain-containing protein n=1 Tax=Taibaiella lutea TaxID=2608001 RepID=A0A5M6CEJ9_9BACT|nr:Ig-like domain-containing protein [Taibaiella lutea]KAA5532312.1 T9SS type A sorting domain-containing protein [Taibaiella lutea]